MMSEADILDEIEQHEFADGLLLKGSETARYNMARLDGLKAILNGGQ